MMLEFVSDDAVAKIADRIDFHAVVRAAFIAVCEEAAQTAPVLRLTTGRVGEGMNLKFGSEGDLLGGKIGSYWAQNAARGLPNHAATTLLFDPETGFPRAMLAARLLNRLRTAAGDAVAVAALSRQDASVLALIGAGEQAPFDARAIASVRHLSEIRVAARDPQKAATVAQKLDGLAPRIVSCSIAEAVVQADIIVTATSARSPLFSADIVAPGCHISAMGADAVGKQELDPGLLATARLFADWPQQANVIGESQYGGTPLPLGPVLAGDYEGRRNDDEITVFDCTGIALQDLYVAQAALLAARAAGLVQHVAW